MTTDPTLPTNSPDRYAQPPVRATGAAVIPSAMRHIAGSRAADQLPMANDFVYPMGLGSPSILHPRNRMVSAWRPGRTRGVAATAGGTTQMVLIPECRSGTAESSRELYLDGDTEGQLGHADGAAGVSALVAEHFDE
jgi:hypothetical protein